MNDMTMTGFWNLYKSHHGRHSDWMAIEVTIPNADATELIINSKKNFEAKMNYYKEAYEEDLVHKGVSAIKIVKYAFALTFADLQAELGL